MERVSKLLGNKNFKKVNNEEAAIRADWINQCHLLTGKPFAQLAALFNGYPTSFIKDLYEQAMSWKTNPVAYFWKLWKTHK